jgi:hypothetical protein
MVCDIASRAALRDPRAAARAIFAECVARDYGGVVLDLEGEPDGTRIELARLTGAEARNRGMRFFASERLALAAGAADCAALVPTALSGGSLETRLREAPGAAVGGRRALEIDIVREDFTLPAPRGEGRTLSAGDLASLAGRHCRTPCFSRELCCNYFTYRSRTARHIVLYDDLTSVRAKLSLGARLGLDAAFVFFPHASDFAANLR